MNNLIEAEKVLEIAKAQTEADIVKTGAKLRPEELATVLVTYCNSGVSGIGEMVKDIFSGMKGAN